MAWMLLVFEVFELKNFSSLSSMYASPWPRTSVMQIFSFTKLKVASPESWPEAI